MSHLSKIAVVGASGSVGKPIVAELLKTGKHEVTAITRSNSQASFPPEVKLARVSYDNEASLVSALRGQQVLIITLNRLTPAGVQEKLVEAAAEAGVAYIFPNVWGADSSHASARDSFVGDRYIATQQHVEKLGTSSWIELACGFWYGFSLAGGIDRFGFDLRGRRVRFYDEGTARMNTSTWEQVGKAISGLLSLKESPSGPDDSGPSLSDYKNKPVYMSSFFISQKDMFASVLRVTGTQESDWDITYERSADRFKTGLDLLRGGDSQGFVQLLYARGFYPEESGGDSAAALQKRHNLINGTLGLPVEDLDERTRAAIGMQDMFLSGPYRN